MGAEADHVYDLLVFTMNMGAEVSALIASMERFTSRRMRNTHVIFLCP